MLLPLYKHAQMCFFKNDNSDELLDGITNLVKLRNQGGEENKQIGPLAREDVVTQTFNFNPDVSCIKQLQGNNKSFTSKSSLNFKLYK